MASQTCKLCNRVVEVVPDGRGFPPKIAENKLRRWCKANGCKCDPQYTPTIRFGPPIQGMEN
jgi:hypothetical protein